MNLILQTHSAVLDMVFHVKIMGAHLRGVSLGSHLRGSAFGYFRRSLKSSHQSSTKSPTHLPPNCTHVGQHRLNVFRQSSNRFHKSCKRCPTVIRRSSALEYFKWSLRSSSNRPPHLHPLVHHIVYGMTNVGKTVPGSVNKLSNSR